jgi:hypothetical protein
MNMGKIAGLPHRQANTGLAGDPGIVKICKLRLAAEISKSQWMSWMPDLSCFDRA